MIDKIKQLANTKMFHIIMIIIIVTVILCAFGIIIIQYQVEGEKDMPFNITKVTLISSSESTDKDSGENRWAFDINQNNDIYIYIEKNKSYTDKEAINHILIDNINVQKNKEIGMKLRLTGGGRCNITNNRDIEEFFDKIVNNNKFLYSALYTFSNYSLLEYLSSNGLEYKVELDEKVYTKSDKADEVIALFEN